MAKKISGAEIEKLVKGQINLPSPPAIAVQILSTVQAEDYSLNDLEQIITADPALTGKLLRIANSSYYSLPSTISSVSRALSVLGTNVIKNIALSFVITTELHRDEDSFFDFDYFWKRSVTAAVAAELVAQSIGEKNDDLFVTALLQDIGILIMYLNKGEDYVGALKNCFVNGGTGLIQSEKELFTFDHQQLSFMLLKDWGLPESIISPILYHHEPEKAPSDWQQAASILDVANVLSAIYSGTETSSNFRILQTKMENYFSVDQDKTREILDEVAVQSIAILEIFDLDPGSIKPYSEILQEANDELGKLNLSYEQLVLELKESKEKSEKFADDLRKANERLEELAFRDGLTGLYNHRYFQEVLEKEIERATRYKHPLGLLLFDIDFFKKVNDTFGHPAGDQVLINLARAVTKSIRPCDVVARYGGEEFAVILPETSFSGVKVFGERLRRCVASVITNIKGSEIAVTISCGASHMAPGKALTKQQFIDTTDQALYESKAGGRNRVTIL